MPHCKWDYCKRIPSTTAAEIMRKSDSLGEIIGKIKDVIKVCVVIETLALTWAVEGLFLSWLFIVETSAVFTLVSLPRESSKFWFKNLEWLKIQLLIQTSKRYLRGITFFWYYAVCLTLWWHQPLQKLNSSCGGRVMFSDFRVRQWCYMHYASMIP